jgi:hypothetical protein
MRQRYGGLLAVAALVTLLAACSASPVEGSSGRSPATTASASPSAESSGSHSATARPAAQRKQVAYSECMRKHGVPGVPTSMPAPALGKPPSSLNAQPGPTNGPDPGSPQWEAAQQACRSLEPSPALMSRP